MRLLSLTHDQSILDIGCGNGYVMNLMARQCHATYTGIDISPSIIETAIRKNRKFVENKKMSFSCQDVNNMEFADGIFDKVYTINTVYFWSDLKVPDEIKADLKNFYNQFKS